MDRIWLVSELFYPEETSTGYYMTRIGAALACNNEVGVIAAQPSDRHEMLAREEVHKGMRIFRAAGTRFDKNNLGGRIVNAVTVAGSMCLHGLRRFRRGDVALVATNPPTAPYVMALACKLKRARCVLLVQDVYPDSMVAAGVLKRSSVMHRLFESMSRALYTRLDGIAVLGRDMDVLVKRKAKGKALRNVHIVHNWADTTEIRPLERSKNTLLAELGLTDRFVVQYAGNIGRVQGIENLFEAARIVARRNPSVHFLFIGDGAKKAWLEENVRSYHLANVTIIGKRPRSEQNTFLNAADVAITGLVVGMSGVGVPSRMYNVFAAGKPMIAAAEVDSEVSLVLLEEKIGWVAPPDDPVALADIVIQASATHPTELMAMGARARAVANEKYSFDAAMVGYRRLIESIS